jgi:hypothetical protein
MAKKPPLSLVGDRHSTGPNPPRPLGKYGRAAWDAVQREYAIEDIGGVEMLALVCSAIDRLEALRAEIDRDGEVLRVRGALKSHPAIRDETALRAFVVRTLSRLGLNYEAVKPVGRPPGMGA